MKIKDLFISHNWKNNVYWSKKCKINFLNKILIKHWRLSKLKFFIPIISPILPILLQVDQSSKYKIRQLKSNLVSCQKYNNCNKKKNNRNHLKFLRVYSMMRDYSKRCRWITKIKLIFYWNKEMRRHKKTLLQETDSYKFNMYL